MELNELLTLTAAILCAKTNQNEESMKEAIKRAEALWLLTIRRKDDK